MGFVVATEVAEDFVVDGKEGRHCRDFDEDVSTWFYEVEDMVEGFFVVLDVLENVYENGGVEESGLFKA